MRTLSVTLENSEYERLEQFRDSLEKHEGKKFTSWRECLMWIVDGNGV